MTAEGVHGSTYLGVLAEFFIESLEIEDKKVLTNKKEKFHGLDSAHTIITGKVGGIPYRYASWIVIRDEVLFRFMMCGFEKATADGKAFDYFKKSVRLLDGKVRRKVAQTTISDTYGIGWRVQDGTFASAAMGLKVTPPEGWRLCVGEDLLTMSDEALVGMELVGHDAYLIVTSKVVFPEDAEAWLQSVKCEEETAHPSEGSGGPVQMEIFGQQREFHVSSDEQPLLNRKFHSKWAEEGHFWEVLAWHSGSQRTDVQRKIEGALKRLTRMPDDETKSLLNDMDRFRDNENAVELDHSLCGGIYRDFKYGFKWTKPEAGMWHAVTGQSARAQGEFVRLYAEELTTGIQLTLMAEQEKGVTAAEGHEVAVSSIKDSHGDPTIGVTKSWQIRGIPALTTIIDGDSNGLPHRHRITTLHQEDLFLTISTGGHRRNFEKFEAVTRIAEQGLLMDARLARANKTKRCYVNQHVGFGLKEIPQSMRFKDVTPKAIRPAGSVVQLVQGKRTLVVIAIVGSGDQQWMLKNILALAKMRSMFSGMSGDPTTTTETTFLGYKGTRLEWKGWLRSSEVRVIKRDRTFYAIITNAIGKSMDQLIDKLYLLD